MIIKHTHQEQSGNTEVLSSHVSKALSSYPFDISAAKLPIGLVGSRTETSSIPSVGQQTKGRKQRGHLFVLTLCLLIIVLILPFTLNFSVSVIPQKKPLDISSTQIAQRQATATAQVQVQATLAAQARAQTTGDITPPINYGKTLYYNAMT